MADAKAPVQASLIAVSATIESMTIKVKTLKENGGFGKTIDKHGLKMTDAGVVYLGNEAKPIKLDGITEVPTVEGGDKKLAEALKAAGIVVPPEDMKVRIFSAK